MGGDLLEKSVEGYASAAGGGFEVTWLTELTGREKSWMPSGGKLGLTDSCLSLPISNLNECQRVVATDAYLLS